jgi:vancomycin resistance protein VanW|tara:strand:+ start:933 stop:1640 length:708 start_codon:yes stop_codon:yes gene_type:complete
VIKSIIPKSIKKSLKLALKNAEDIFSGHWFYFAKNKIRDISYSKKIIITQKLKPNDAKVHNLKKAIELIESVHIMPNEIFSFCNIIGNTTASKGYVASRSLTENNISETIGGGICQISGLIYYISLIGNLEILERHNHSTDIYDDETRFTPLGSDATIVYGYKDLKIKNNTKGPINFKFHLNNEKVTIQLDHNITIKKNQVDFKTANENLEKITINTIINEKKYDTSCYLKSKGK